MELLWIVSIVVSVLVLWFNTHFFIEYTGLLRLHSRLKITDWKKAVETDLATPPYIMWLNMKYNNFWTRLIVCPFCVGFWLVLSTCLYFEYYNVPLAYLSVLFVYFSFETLLKYSGGPR